MQFPCLQTCDILEAYKLSQFTLSASVHFRVHLLPIVVPKNLHMKSVQTCNILIGTYGTPLNIRH